MAKKYSKRGVGDIIESKNFGPYEIIEIDRSEPKNPICTVRFLNSGNIVKSSASKAYYGTVQDWTQPSVLGRGIIFPGASVDFKREYYLWLDMMCRCYTENPKDKNVRKYKDVEVHERWWTLKNFIQDIPKLPGYEKWIRGENVHLDKDLLSQGNKLYSASTCHFIDAISNCQAISKPQAKKVKHIETGEVFESIGVAAKKFGLNRTYVSRHCRGQAKCPKFKFI